MPAVLIRYGTYSVEGTNIIVDWSFPTEKHEVIPFQVTSDTLTITRYGEQFVYSRFRY